MIPSRRRRPRSRLRVDGGEVAREFGSRLPPSGTPRVCLRSRAPGPPGRSESRITSYALAGILVTGASETVTLGMPNFVVTGQRDGGCITAFVPGCEESVGQRQRLSRYRSALFCSSGLQALAVQNCNTVVLHSTSLVAATAVQIAAKRRATPVSYTHLTLPTKA